VHRVRARWRLMICCAAQSVASVHSQASAIPAQL
jgi:hypothetical protein